MSGYTFDTTSPLPEATGYEVLPTDIYVMKITEAVIEDDKYAEADRNGDKPKKLVITWVIDKLTQEQSEAGIKLGEKVWQRITPWYGLVKAGGPSKFKAFIDSFIEQGLLEQRFSTEDLVGITQRVNVEEYIKTMGQNAGSPGNRVTAVASLTPKRRQSAAPAPKAAPPEDEDLPF